MSILLFLSSAPVCPSQEGMNRELTIANTSPVVCPSQEWMNQYMPMSGLAIRGLSLV